MVEEYWHQIKRDLRVSEYHSTVVHMCRALSEYFGTARLKLDAMKFINRMSLSSKNFELSLYDMRAIELRRDVTGPADITLSLIVHIAVPINSCSRQYA